MNTIKCKINSDCGHVLAYRSPKYSLINYDFSHHLMIDEDLFLISFMKKYTF